MRFCFLLSASLLLPSVAALQLHAADESAPSPAAQNARVLFVIADDCDACDVAIQKLEAEGGAFPALRAADWKIGPDADSHIQIVNAAAIAPLVERWTLHEFPAVLAVEGEQIVRSFKDGCSTPLDPDTFRWLLQGFDERTRPAVPAGVTVETTGHYPLRGNHWSVDGDWAPDHAEMVGHLRGPNHNRLFPREWAIESWSHEELRALHDDLHEQNRPLPLQDEANTYVARPAYRAPAAAYSRSQTARPARSGSALSRAAARHR